MTFLLGMAVSLPAQTLTVGSPSIAPGGTATIPVTLATGGASIAGLQFDIIYDSRVTNMSITLGSAATAANKEISPPTAIPNTNYPSAGPGQRVVIIGVGPNDLSVPNTADNTFASAGGVVANLAVTVSGTAALGSTIPLTLANVAATTAGAQGVAPVSVTLTPANGTITVQVVSTYLVGDVAPFTTNTVGGFGDGVLDIQDLIQEFFAVNNVSTPPTCSDRFDAMDTSPADSGTTRGGNGVLDIQDLILEFFRVNNVDPSRPTRASLGLCPGSTNMTANVATPARRAVAKPPAEIGGTLLLGSAEGSGTAQERVPVYLQAGRDLVRVALTFGLGDQKSQLRFEAAPGTVPSMLQDGQPGYVVAAWLEGLNVNAGQRLLLGYIVGPSGSAENLKVFGVSASGLTDNRLVGLNVSGAELVQQ
jgi:hypothetical protein